MRDQINCLTFDGSPLGTQELQKFISKWNQMSTEEICEFWARVRTKGQSLVEGDGCQLTKEFFIHLDMIILLYSVMCPTSFRSVLTTWSKLLPEKFPNAKIFLVGTKPDLRSIESPGQSIRRKAVVFSDIVGTPQTISCSSDQNRLFSQIKEELCAQTDFKDLWNLMRVCKSYYCYITQSITKLFLQSLDHLESVSYLHGKFLARLIGAVGFAECNLSIHLGYYLSNGQKAVDELRKINQENKLTLKVRTWGGDSAAPELDMLWATIIRMFYEMDELGINKWD